MILSCNLSDRPTADGQCNSSYTPTPGQQTKLANESTKTAEMTETSTRGWNTTIGTQTQTTGACVEERSIAQSRQTSARNDARTDETVNNTTPTPKREDASTDDGYHAGEEDVYEDEATQATGNDEEASNEDSIEEEMKCKDNHPPRDVPLKDGRWQYTGWQKYMRTHDTKPKPKRWPRINIDEGCQTIHEEEATGCWDRICGRDPPVKPQQQNNQQLGNECAVFSNP